MKAILWIIVASLLSPLVAQDVTRPPRPRTGQQPGAPVMKEAGANGLSRNITIRLQGTTTTNSEIDLELTGTGPTFNAQQMVGKDESVLSCQYSVAQAEGGYRVSYSIGMRVKVVTNIHKDTTNYEYRDVTINGSALCAAGKPVTIVRNGGKPLELVVTAVEAVEGKPTPPTAPVEEH
jgi:hypothetical protein